MKFPLDLVARVRSSLERIGYCFLNSDEIQRLLARVPVGRQTRQDAMREFAELCAARVETTSHLKSARFTPLAVTEHDTIQEREFAFHPPDTATA